MILTPIPVLLWLHILPAGPTPTPTGPVRGHCIESRTASVFAGACHYGAEATTGGREALVAWRFESGSHLGVDLSGVVVAAAIAGDANLADPKVARRSILYFSDSDTLAARQAAGELLRTRFDDVLGEISREQTLPLREEFDGERYHVRGADLFDIEGALLPDRACCKMPFGVWYRPFTPLTRAVVGCNAVFRYSDARLGPVWERFEENTAFAGAFALPSDPSDPSDIRP